MSYYRQLFLDLNRDLIPICYGDQSPNSYSYHSHNRFRTSSSCVRLTLIRKIENSNFSGWAKIKIILFLRQNSGRSIVILLAISFVHRTGSACVEANLPNIFSWLLWLSISFYVILSAYDFGCQLLLSRLSQSIAVNFQLFE